MVFVGVYFCARVNYHVFTSLQQHLVNLFLSAALRERMGMMLCTCVLGQVNTYTSCMSRCSEKLAATMSFYVCVLHKSKVKIACVFTCVSVCAQMRACCSFDVCT